MPGKEKICIPCDRAASLNLFGRYYETDSNGVKKPVRMGRNPKGFQWSCQSGEAPCFSDDIEQVTNERKWVFNVSALACERS